MASKILSIKGQLASAIVESIGNGKRSQRSVAALCGVSQPRISNLVSGQLDQFSVDALIEIAQVVGCFVSLCVLPAQKPVSMNDAFMLPREFEIDPNGFREGCEAEFRFA